jgi:cupin superfamily acireductone dioxygenase involved in methionine salvage
MKENIISKWLFKYGNEIIRKNTEQEIIEEAASDYAYNNHDLLDVSHHKGLKQGFIACAKWQQERMYNEEEVRNILIEYIKTNPTKPYRVVRWFEQFKKEKAL